jgi:hypothetical protein
MKHLAEVFREVYGHGPRAINLHSVRLSRTLDGCPPFFEAYGPYRTDHEGVLPRLKVNGQDYWGSGWSWQRAFKAFCKELN